MDNPIKASVLVKLDRNFDKEGAGCALLEGPLPYSHDGQHYFIVLNVYGWEVLVLDLEGNVIVAIETDSAVGSCALGQNGTLLYGTRTGLYRVSPFADTPSPEKVCELPINPNLCRTNDGQTAPDGTLVVGTIVDRGDGAFSDHIAGAFTVKVEDGKPALKQIVRNGVVSNGHCWNSDGSVFYYVESTEDGTIRAYDWDKDGATIENDDDFTGPTSDLQTIEVSGVTFPNGDCEGTVLLGELLDGGAITDNGHLVWAVWGASKLVDIDPDASEGEEVVREIEVPFRRPTCPAFVGEDLTTLVVTSEWKEGDPEDEKGAIAILNFEDGTKGVAPNVANF